MRRLAPVTLITIGVLALLTWYVIYTRGVVRELRREASRVGLMYARVYNGLTDPNPDGATSALLDLSRSIRESGVPMILTDVQGRPTDTANLPFSSALGSPAMRSRSTASSQTRFLIRSSRPGRRSGRTSRLASTANSR